MRIISSLFLFLFFSGISFWLMHAKYIQSGDFVLLVVISSVIALIISYFDSIQELSIGGNIVKLKEAKKELEVTIEELKSVKISTFRMLLLRSLNYSGVWGSSHLVDTRADYFFSLIKEIKDAGCFDDLKQEISTQLKILLKMQLDRFYKIFYDKNFDNDSFPLPMHFYIDLSSEVINKVHQNQTPVKPFEDKKQEILQAIDTYAKLFIIFKEIHD